VEEHGCQRRAELVTALRECDQVAAQRPFDGGIGGGPKRRREHSDTGDQREAVLLKVYQGFKFEEMAEILSCPVSTVKSRLYTALDLLKVMLAPVNVRNAP